MSQPLSKPKEIKQERTKPKKLKPAQQKTNKSQWDDPGCCDVPNCIVYWNGKRWVHMPDNGGCGEVEIEVHFCPFCGTKLDSDTPAKKRK